MEHTLIRVLIADDEPIVREGLKCIIDWEALGFSICGEAVNGQDTADKIQTLQPELVLLDIRMPKLSGTELIEQARKSGYSGEFIILSGYSDFTYAQTAIRHGVAFYLTKPIDEDELENALALIKEKINRRQERKNSLQQYLLRAKSPILSDLLHGSARSPSMNYEEMGLIYPVYQVLIYEWYSPFYHSYSFSDLLRVSNQGHNSFEHLILDGYDVVLLKGSFALDRFQDCLRHYDDEGPQHGSPLDGIFFAYGPPVPSLERIHDSYDICCRLMERRFFCDENQHVLSYDMLPKRTAEPLPLSLALSRHYGHTLVNYIQSYNRRQISATLMDLRQVLYDSGENIHQIKYFLTDIFLQIKQSIMHLYSSSDIPFAHNAAIIELIEGKSYLYEILRYFSEQCEIIIRVIGNNSSDSIFDDILHYINHNYSQSLKLESISPLFGYNSSYLGKLFSQKINQSFNSYLDSVRLNEAMHMLATTDKKVYEISAQVGYKNVDYFHQKFKKQVGCSPAEYRKRKIST